MRGTLLRQAVRLAGRGEAFVVATVVRREPPSSARVGDAALITASGEFHGWLGGSCTEPLVVREALAALRDGRPRLIALSPDPDSDGRPGVRALPMTCHSGGTVEIYIEPAVPAPRLLVFGSSSPARALARLAEVLGHRVIAIDPDATPEAFPGADAVLTEATAATLGGDAAPTFAVVATLGQRDEQAIRQALASGAIYIGAVASRKRFEQVRRNLIARGTPPADLERIDNPAGLDIGAVTPEEIALSILTRIVQVWRADAGRTDLSDTPAAGSANEQRAIDPICGMTVDPQLAEHRAERDGTTYYFCCGGCREQFLAESRSST